MRGFLDGQRMRTATMDTKLVQQLAHLEQKMLYETFIIDLKKVYDTMDRE